jgi:DNA-binding MarR family transcriptional regulator
MAAPERKRVAERLHSAALHLLRRLREVDAKAQVGPSRLSVLSILVFGGPATPGELAAAEQVKPPTMSKLVRGLEDMGFVARDSGDDRRSVILRATPKGRKILLEARTRRLELFAGMLEQANADDLATLSKASDIIDRLLT